jgi:DNA-binding transcriptional MerR regulator
MWGSKRVAKFVGVKYATLDHWIRSGLLSCNSPNDGTGNPRSWSAADVARAAVVGELRRHGYSLQAVRGSGILGR